MCVRHRQLLQHARVHTMRALCLSWLDLVEQWDSPLDLCCSILDQRCWLSRLESFRAPGTSDSPPPPSKHWPKCSCIINVYIPLLLCKVFNQSFCRTICWSCPFILTCKLSPFALPLSHFSTSYIHDVDGPADHCVATFQRQVCSYLKSTKPA